MSLTDRLTERQRAVYEFIREKITRRGYGPTVREIGEEFGIKSPNGVMCHLKALEKKELIRRGKNKSRAIELVGNAGGPDRGLPLVGQIAAGQTTLAFEQSDRVDFDELLRGENRFALEVNGDSMIDAHIDDGDFVVVNRQETANSGDIVVAQTDGGEATLKYWYPEAGKIRLQPANASLEPIYVEQANVLGVVVGVVRKLA